MPPNRPTLNKDLINSLDWESHKSEKVSDFTINDLKQELLKPGRDPRKKAKVFSFDERLSTINDLKEGMILNGLVNSLY